MKTEPIKTNESLPISTYLKLMRDIEFMQPYMEEPDIFNPESDKFKSFLIQSFCHLHPDFHYLSFLNEEDIDSEIIKTAGIFQILPTNNTEKRNKLFDYMCKDDIHKFWLKFFSLFKKQDDFTTDSIFNISWINKLNFFKDMKNSLNYLNYEFPVVKGKKVIDDIISEELDTWKELRDCTLSTPDESVCLYFDENQTNEVDINSLITDLQQVLKMYSSKKFISKESKLEHLDFFANFVHLTKNILNHKKNLNIINTELSDKDNLKLDENILENLYFIKRCNNNMKTLKSEVKSLNKNFFTV